MSNLIELQNNFRLGMRRDFPRHQMPDGTVWNLQNAIPDLGSNSGPLRMRGGWSYASGSTSVGVPVSVLHVSHSAGGFESRPYSVLSSCNQIYSADGNSANSLSSIGATGSIHSDNPIFFRSFWIQASGTGTAQPTKMDGDGVIDLLDTSSPSPSCIYQTVYKNRMVQANDASGNPNIRSGRIVFFSGDGNPLSWDRTTGFIELPDIVTGIYGAKNALLIWGRDRMFRIRGTIPPPGSDMYVDEFASGIGFDNTITANNPHRSIKQYKDGCFFSTRDGVYYTDGIELRDLTTEFGLKQFWRENFNASYTPTAGVYNGTYIVSLHDNSFNIADTFCFDVEKGHVYRMTNWYGFNGYASPFVEGNNVTSTFYDTLFCNRNSARLMKPSLMFEPGASSKNDADGTGRTVTIETPYYMLDPGGQKIFNNLYLGYDLVADTGDDPIVTVSYIRTPEATSYTTISPTLGETSGYERRRLPLKFTGHGFALRLVVSATPSDFKLYNIAVEVDGKEPSAVWRR